MGFYTRLLYEINEYVHKYPDFSVDMLASVFSGKRISQLRFQHNKKIIDDFFAKSEGINKEQFLSAEEAAENQKRLEKFFQITVPRLAHYSKLSELEVDPILGHDYGNDALNRTVVIMMHPDGTPEAERFNQRIAKSWDYGTDEDRAGIIREFLDEVERIDLAKWAEKDSAYIVDHFAEYNREISMVKSAKVMFTEAVKFGYMKEDPARLEHYHELYIQAEIDHIRTDFAVSKRLMPLSSVLQISGLEHFCKYANPDDKIEKLATRTNPFKRTNGVAKEALEDLENSKKESALYYFYQMNDIRESYEKFTEKCREKRISVPTTLQEYNERYAQEFKDFEPTLSEACYEVLNTKKRKNCVPWETEKYKIGQKISEDISLEEIIDHQAYDLYKDFDDIIFTAKGTYERQIDAEEMETSDDRGGRRYKDTLESVKAYLGYRDSEQLPFVLGGEHNGELITNSGALKKLSDAGKTEYLYAKTKTGKIMSFKLDYSEINGLSRDANAIHDASEEEILALQKKQGADLRRKLAGILGVNNDLENVGAGSDELIRTVDQMRRSSEENDQALNNLCAELADKASGLRNDLLNKSRTVRLSDKEGKALNISEKLIELGNNSYIGVPDSHSEIASRMKEKANGTVPTSEQVLLKMTRACETLNATCSGIRNDSEEFKFLHESAKTLLDNLKYAERNGIKMNADSLREEYSRVFTAAKKYMEHRKNMPTKNGRTQTRVSLAKDLLAVGEALECKELTPTELVAHSINDKLIVSYLRNLKNNPNSEKETKYLKKCLSNRKEADSVIRNNEFFCKTANGMTREKLLKSAYSEDGRSSFIEKVTAVRNKHEEAERKKAAENPNNVRHIKDTGIYKKMLNNVQYTIRSDGKINRYHVIPGDIEVYFFDKLLLNTIKRLGNETVNSDAELMDKLSILRKLNKGGTKIDCRNLIGKTDAFKSMMRELKAEETRKYGVHKNLAQMDFYVTQADKYFARVEEEMHRKYGTNVVAVVDNRNIINADVPAGNKGVIRTDKIANDGNSNTISTSNKEAGRVLS